MVETNPPRFTGPSKGSDQSAREQMARLSKREVEVVRLIAYGATNAEVAEALVVSERTVHTHIRRALRRTGARHRTHLAVLAVWAGLAPETSSPDARRKGRRSTPPEQQLR